MAAVVVNECIKFQQAISPRVLPANRTLNVATDATVIKVSSGGTPAPASVHLTATPPQGLSGTVTWSTSPTVPLTVSGNSATLNYSDMGTGNVSVTASLTVGGTQFTGSVTITQAKDGATGPNGNNVGTFYAYKRAASAPTDNPGNVTVDFTQGVITTATLANGWSKTIPATNGNPLYVEVISGSAAGSTASLLASGWSAASLLVQDGATGATGNPGLNVATVQVYQRTSTQAAPALPSAATTYTFSTGVLTGLNNGWQQGAPPATSDKPYLQMTLATASATTATDSIAASEWSAAQVVAKDGLDGTFSRKASWEFRNTLDGWTFTNITSTQNADSVTATATTGDPQIISGTLSIDGSLYDKIRARVRRTAGSAWQGDAYYATSGHSFVETDKKTVSVDPTIGGAWVIIEWDMANLTAGGTDWKTNTITQIRIDLGNSSADVFEIDWIAIGKAGPVNLPDLGQHLYRMVTAGSAATNVPATIALYMDGVTVPGFNLGRSYTVTVISRTTGLVTSSTVYDVFGSAANATSMASALNALTSSSIVLVTSYDEPQANRLMNGLDTAMYRCGASRMVYGSTNFQYRSAYVLVGIPGCGEGNGAEAYQGAVSSDVNAWVDIAFTVVNGMLSGVTANFIPKSLTDYGYTGELNANFTPLGKGSCLNDDPFLEKPAVWSLSGGLTYNTYASPTSVANASGSHFFDSPPGSATDQFAESVNKFAIDAHKTYNLTANLYAGSSNNRSVYIYVNFYDDAGTLLTGTNTPSLNWGGSKSGYVYGGLPPTGQWSRQGGQFGAGTSRAIPSAARTCTVGIWFQYSGNGSGSIEQAAQSIRLELASDNGLIAPAAVTVDKLSVSQLSAITAVIGMLQTASSGARLVIQDNAIKCYDTSNVLRGQFGDLTL